MGEPRLQAEHDDAVLVKAVIQGEMMAFKKLINKYEKLVNSIVYKMVGQIQDREDISQETFLRVYKYLPSFKFKSRLSTWIGNIAFNLCINFLKKKKPHLLDDMYKPGVDSQEETYNIHVEIKDQSPLPDESLFEKEKQQFLFKAIEDLNPVERTLLQLFHHEELSIEEISIITTIPVNTVKSHLFRTRIKLKDQLTKILNS